jgi:predicted transcriptional regulator
MSNTFDALAFFGGSRNRVRLFEALATGTRTRQGLQREVGVNRVTAGRVLSDLTAHGWVEQRDGKYAVTPLGEVVADALDSFDAHLTAAATLDGILEWLPLAEMGLDVTWLAEATVTRPERSDPQATLRRAHETVRGATDLAMLSHAFTPAIIETTHRRVTAGELTLEIIVTAEVVDVVAGDADLAPKLRDDPRRFSIPPALVSTSGRPRRSAGIATRRRNYLLLIFLRETVRSA